MNDNDISHSRRRFITGAGALVLGVFLPTSSTKANILLRNKKENNSTIAVNSFIHIDTEGIVTILSKHIEFGQGVYTGMATLVSEELDANWSNIRVISAPVNTDIYKNIITGFQGTGGSSSLASSYIKMRQMGAMAKALLINAAALKWGVQGKDITVSNGIIYHNKSGKSGGFGEFVTIAATLPAPDVSTLTLKNENNFNIIGKEKGLHRIDTIEKINGKAKYAQDILEENMLVVTIKKPIRFGAKLVSFDASDSLKTFGVVAVKVLENSIAIYAKNSWAAIQGRRKITAVWDNSTAENRSTDDIFSSFREKAKHKGEIAALVGDPDASFIDADSIIEAEYTFPYIAHAPMEPLSGYIFWDGDTVRAKYGSQIPTFDQNQFCEYFNIPKDKVYIETTLAGGSFGRRIDLGNKILGPDLVADMSAAALAIGPGQGIKVISTREDDIQNGWYRPMVLHRLRAAIKNNKIVAWTNTIAGNSFSLNSVFNALIVDGVDGLMIEGSKETPYTFKNFRCDTHIMPTKVTTSSLRSVASTHTCHAVESFIDQLLFETGQDPVEGRLALMTNAPREANVLKAVAKAANWKGPNAIEGRMRGVGVATAFGTRVAQIAEVSIDELGKPKIHKVWCAVDCGIAVNPNVIKAQIEGGIGYGLGIALYGNISFKKGVIEQSNFNNFRPLRINEMPEIEVIIIPSVESPTGVGELGLPTISPAIGNALARLGRERKTLSPPFHRV